MWRAQQATLQDMSEGQERDAAPRQDAGAGADFVSRTHSTVAVDQVSDRTPAQESNASLSQIRALCKPLSQWMSIAQHTDILEQLRHRCCLCSQWVANIRSIKLHVLKVHSEFYNTAGAAALADCREIGHLISPCRYCGAQVSKTSQHASACPVLWQLRLGLTLLPPIPPPTVVATDMDQDEATLYQYLLHHKRPAPSGEPRITGERPAKSPASQAQRKRPRSEEIETSATPSKSRIERWLRIGCNSQGVGQVDTPSRRLYNPPPDRSHRVDDVQPG